MFMKHALSTRHAHQTMGFYVVIKESNFLLLQLSASDFFVKVSRCPKSSIPLTVLQECCENHRN